MKKIKFCIAVAILLVTACSKEKDGPNPMTMTTKQSNVIFYMTGTGTVTIDWGDKTEKETYPLFGIEYGWDAKHSYNHAYSGTSTHIITITGENITHLFCGYIGLSGLDVSRNPMLIELHCLFNQLTDLDVRKNTKLKLLSASANLIASLDISKNTELEDLRCGGNQLTILDVSRNTELVDLYCNGNPMTSLDVSNNTKLTTLVCDDSGINNLNVRGLTSLTRLVCGKSRNDIPGYLGNSLTSLDVSGCISLSYLCCENNLLSVGALNALFETLHNNMIVGGKDILISNNPGTNECLKSIAENKGWWVTIR